MEFYVFIVLIRGTYCVGFGDVVSIDVVFFYGLGLWCFYVRKVSISGYEELYIVLVLG